MRTAKAEREYGLYEVDTGDGLGFERTSVYFDPDGAGRAYDASQIAGYASYGDQINLIDVDNYVMV